MTLIIALFGKKAPEISPLTPFQLEHLLRTAEPAEHSGIPYPCLGAGAETVEYPHLHALETRDGVWRCCCGHENPLVHFKGTFPFKHLKCGSCDHVLCEHCETMDMITLLHGEGDTKIRSHNNAELRLQVCPSCGLSHRAEFRTPDHHGERLCWVPMASRSHAETCLCGEAAKFEWRKYAIGTPHGFRLNPEKAAHSCQMKMMQKKIIMAASRYPQKFPEHAEERVDSLWECPGLRRMEAFNALETAHTFVQDTRACPSTRASTQLIPISQGRHQEMTVNINESWLKRSGAHRGKPPSYNHSATHHESPVAPRPPLTARAETWTTAEGHRQAHEVAEAAMKPSFKSRFDPRGEDESSMDGTAQHVRPASTLEDVPCQPLSRVQTDGPCSNVRTKSNGPTRKMKSNKTTRENSDWAETYRLYNKKMGNFS